MGLTQIYDRKQVVSSLSLIPKKERTHLKAELCVSSDEQNILPVLSADWAGDVDGTIQRVRLSPSESMLAATLKSSHSEESRCMLVRLEPSAIPQEPMLILDNVFSFGKTERHMQVCNLYCVFLYFIYFCE